MTHPLYDTIGVGYRAQREPDGRLAATIAASLGDARSVVNVGAGAGSYEVGACRVAVEPSRAMIAQRARGTAPAVRAVGERLPFADDAFDAALAVLTMHHWRDRARGLDELLRVARRRVVVVTWDPAFPGFWLTDLFPDVLRIDAAIFPALDEFERPGARTRVAPLLVPHDCTDGFLGAYWRRPHAYLDPRVRAAMSTFAKLDDAAVARGLARLRDALDSGAWQRDHADLLERAELDLGYRLVTLDVLHDSAVESSPASRPRG